MKQVNQSIQCGRHTLPIGKETMIMGILNITPDSFSDGGQYASFPEVTERVKKLVNDGAHIIDIGGESTRPGANKVSVEEELSRVIPMIQVITKTVDVPLSIDTYKAEVAKQAIEAGASIINDIWGAKADTKMASVAAHYQVPIVLMHNRENTNYQNLMIDVIDDLYESIKIAKRAGVHDEHIILDPGIGFAKTYEQNLEVMKNLNKIVELGYPVLLGTSRKSFIGLTLDLPVEERLEGTGATVCLGIERGCHIVRVHDVKEMARMAKMMDAMLGKRDVSNG